MFSIISSFYKGIKAVSLEKNYQKGIYYLLESIAGSLFLILICLIVVLCK